MVLRTSGFGSLLRRDDSSGQAGATVFDDGARDNLSGGSGRDWFFADLDGLDGDDDILPGLKGDELIDLL